MRRISRVESLTNFIGNENSSIGGDKNFVFEAFPFDNQQVARLHLILLHDELLKLKWCFDVGRLRSIHIYARHMSFEDVVRAEESFKIFRHLNLSSFIWYVDSYVHREGDRFVLKCSDFTRWQ